MADTCGTCRFYDGIDDEQGNCKISAIKRKMTHAKFNKAMVKNGWPVTKTAELACAEWKQIV